MQNKFNTYTKELEEILNKLNSIPSFANISSKDLPKYKNLIARKEYLQKKINTMLEKRTNIIGTYNDKNRIWNMSKINCRKYCKLEQKASYLRDLELYKLGFLNTKPTSPFIQNFKKNILENISWNLSVKHSDLNNKLISYKKSITQKSPIYKGIKKTKTYIKNDLPITITNAAISGVKKCIVSYRNLNKSVNNSFHSFSRNISYSTPIRIMAFIANQAKQEANIEQNAFMERIRVNPYTMQYAHCTSPVISSNNKSLSFSANTHQLYSKNFSR